MASPAAIAREIADAVSKLQNVLTLHHGVYRGTAEAVLSEAQGGTLIQTSEEVTTHLSSLQQAATSLTNTNAAIIEKLTELRRVSPPAAGQLSQALRPLLNLARQRIALLEQVEAVASELEALHPERLVNMPLISGARDAGGLITTQISRFTTGPLRPTGVPLIPSGVAVEASVQSLLQQIRQLPVNAAEATAQVSAVMMGVRVALTTAAATAGSSLVEFFGTAMEVLLLIGTDLITIPLFIIPKNWLDGRADA